MLGLIASFIPLIWLPQEAQDMLIAPNGYVDYYRATHPDMRGHYDDYWVWCWEEYYDVDVDGAKETRRKWAGIKFSRDDIEKSLSGEDNHLQHDWTPQDQEICNPTAN